MNPKNPHYIFDLKKNILIYTAYFITTLFSGKMRRGAPPNFSSFGPLQDAAVKGKWQKSESWNGRCSGAFLRLFCIVMKSNRPTTVERRSDFFYFFFGNNSRFCFDGWFLSINFFTCFYEFASENRTFRGNENPDSDALWSKNALLARDPGSCIEKATVTCKFEKSWWNIFKNRECFDRRLFLKKCQIIVETRTKTRKNKLFSKTNAFVPLSKELQWMNNFTTQVLDMGGFLCMIE